MKKNEKTQFAIYLSLFFVGISISLSWAYYTSRLLGLGLIIISSLLSYRLYAKNHAMSSESSPVSLKLVSYGLFLIIMDLAYNLYTGGNIGSLDIGLLSAGVFIVLLNLFGSKLLKLDEKIIEFATYFVFITILVFSTLFYGMEHLFGENGDENPLYTLFAYFVVLISHYVLSLIHPTTVVDNTINFNGFSVFVGYGCTGIESFAVYISALIAYFYSFSNISKKNFILYAVIGVGALYLMNVLRVIVLVLIGYYAGSEMMMIFHAHLGWIMFVMGMAVFWYFALNKQNI
jgi:archaeosortase C (PEF-CTERM variant)